ncbi:hypothetical protein RND71_023415 [Anisodus tanguticus]|uniref:Uncharacterized protein n=1 Tax=Anisodus tanguticus TaxID=243964 RepID=A0AAE1VER0_9SOLA|nr:hypothetical protein RND71_023415 [Anisodus tanguticus]
MKELLKIVEFHIWNHLFSPPAPNVFEEEVSNFCGNLSATVDDTLVLNVNGTDFVLDEEKLSEILGVPTDGLKIVKGSGASTEFLNAIVKQERIGIGATIFKKLLKPEYQLIFEFFNKVLLPRAERRTQRKNKRTEYYELLQSTCRLILPNRMLFIPLRMSDEQLMIGDDYVHGEKYDPTRHGWHGSTSPPETTNWLCQWS